VRSGHNEGLIGPTRCSAEVRIHYCSTLTRSDCSIHVNTSLLTILCTARNYPAVSFQKVYSRILDSDDDK